MPVRTQARIFATFVVLVSLFNGAYQIERRVSGRYFDVPFTHMVASAAAGVGQRLLPIPVALQGAITLTSGHAAVVLRAGCNGVETLFLMLAGILAYPAPWRRRGMALLLYLPGLFVLNIARVLGLLYVITCWPDYIQLAHDQIAQGVMVIFVFAFWVHHVHRADA